MGKYRSRIDVVLGFDPGKNVTGWASVALVPADRFTGLPAPTVYYLGSGTWDWNGHPDGLAELDEFVGTLGPAEKMRAAEQIGGPLPSVGRPCEIAAVFAGVEATPFVRYYAPWSFRTGMVTGAIEVALARRGITVYEGKPQNIRAYLGPDVKTPADVRRWIKERLIVPKVPPDHQRDAVAAAVAAVVRNFCAVKIGFAGDVC